uniref:hypothetical protein n=1 Tax=Pararhizobium sp. IMCC3301 TaxID=3067904 RepID=UPI002741FDC7|nr:hypothetical protein [Pararhizobium sp. IMCC3301]
MTKRRKTSAEMRNALQKPVRKPLSTAMPAPRARHKPDFHTAGDHEIHHAVVIPQTN